MITRLINWFSDPFGFERRRRSRLMAEALPQTWISALDSLPLYRVIPAHDQEKLRQLIQLFRHHKSFEGCGGLELTDKIMLTIAAHACLLILRRDDPPYPGLRSILVYPESYVAKYIESSGPWRIREEEAAMLGTSWTSGTVILAWSAVEVGSRYPHDGHNVALHEFAHQLDQENGSVDGAPGLLRGRPIKERRLAHAEWKSVLTREFKFLQEAVAKNKRTLLDPYGATDPAEFFAVATETFFERPMPLWEQHPALYEQLQLYYEQDPVSWNWS